MKSQELLLSIESNISITRYTYKFYAFVCVSEPNKYSDDYEIYIRGNNVSYKDRHDNNNRLYLSSMKISKI